MDSSALKYAFEKNLNELGLSFQRNSDNSYLLCNTNETGRTVKVKLICSLKSDKIAHGSRNGNPVQSIGIFKFGVPPDQDDFELYILAFDSSNPQKMDFIIIPSDELRKRLVSKTRNSFTEHRISVVFWLMDDRFLYECTNVGIEWEWYFLSQGPHGRLADGSKWDYSRYLNDWGRLKYA